MRLNFKAPFYLGLEPEFLHVGNVLKQAFSGGFNRQGDEIGPLVGKLFEEIQGRAGHLDLHFNLQVRAGGGCPSGYPGRSGGTESPCGHHRAFPCESSLSRRIPGKRNPPRTGVQGRVNTLQVHDRMRTSIMKMHELECVKKKERIQRHGGRVDDRF